MGGGDKCLLHLGDRSLLDIAIERLRPQVDRLLLSVNGDPARFAATGLPAATDLLDGHAGPLAGILTAMAWNRKGAVSCEWLLSIAADTPFFPLDLGARLLDSAIKEGAEVAVAASGGRLHPVFGLWHHSLEQDLRQALLQRGTRKMHDWLQRHRWTAVEFPPQDGVDPFFNINSPGELDRALTLLDGGCPAPPAERN
jgi:molybdopterin-guanine dinucleotide biosynthesis protein A